MKIRSVAVAAACLCAAQPMYAQTTDSSAEAPTGDAAQPAETEAAPEAAAQAEATAQPPAPARPALTPSVPADGCELHIWPAERMASVTTGWLGGGLLDVALHSGTDANNKTLLASALDSPSQLDALLSLDLRKELDLTPGTTFIVHEQPLERKTMNKVKTRRSDSTASCYSELIVADVFYQKAAIYGRSLKTLFMVRKFDNAQKINFEYKAWGGNGLKLFPPKEGQDAIPALDELVSVFKANFQEYARNERTSTTAVRR